MGFTRGAEGARGVGAHEGVRGEGEGHDRRAGDPRAGAGGVGGRRVVEAQTGAHLYGTATPQSDFDVTFVYVPAARDILLQRARPSLGPARELRALGGEDAQGHSLQRFLELLSAGQPAAVELLFAPDESMLSPPDPVWREVQTLGPRLITRGAGVFARYCRRQAAMYGARGQRAAAARQTLAMLAAAEATHGTQARLEVIAAQLARLARTSDHIDLVDVRMQTGRVVSHLEICGRKTPLTASLGAARQAAERLIAAYGARTLEAGQQGGVDWKALSHAVRVGREAVELFTTGRLNFPLACAPRLLDIKLGRVPHDEIADEIDTLLGEVERAASRSSLPAEPDRSGMEDLVVRVYRAAVQETAA